MFSRHLRSFHGPPAREWHEAARRFERYASVVRENVALAAVTALVLVGCGSSSLLAPDAGPLHDASTADASPDVASVDAGHLDASTERPDVGPLLPCEAGAPFILVSYAGRSTLLPEGCGGAPDVPSLGLSQCTCAEDCFPTASEICGTSDAGSLELSFSRPIGGPADSVGVYPIGCQPSGFTSNDSWTLGSSTSRLQQGQVHLQTFEAVGGTVTGDFVATLSPEGGTIAGTFCVARVQ